jgi:hypothetical protein
MSVTNHESQYESRFLNTHTAVSELKTLLSGDRQKYNFINIAV